MLSPPGAAYEALDIFEDALVRAQFPRPAASRA